jgi:hypothetical protein
VPLSTDQYEINQSGTSKKITPTVMHPRARRSHTTDYAIANNTLTALVLNTSVYDTGSFYSALHTSRLTAAAAGLYLISGSVEWDNGTTTGRRLLALYVNGADEIAVVDDGLTTHTNRVEMNISVQYVLAAADYVELKAYQTSGGSLNILQEDFYSPIFSITLLSP